jgi:hypothetical protein
VMNVSMMLLPFHEYRASSHAINKPGGRINKAARKADCALNQIIWSSDSVIWFNFYHRDIIRDFNLKSEI